MYCNYTDGRYLKSCRREVYYIQRNLSITDTLGPDEQFAIQRFPLFRGYFTCATIYLVPQNYISLL